MSDLDALTDTILLRCDQLADCSEESGRLTRPFLCKSMHRVHDLLTKWMLEAGLVVRFDNAGNMIGRKKGRSDCVFAVGSHADTVPNAGKYDGNLGVILGIAAAQVLGDRLRHRNLDVIAFSEEEGVRFSTPYLGSRAVCGVFEEALLSRRDADNVTLSQALCDYGLDPKEIHAAAYRHGELTGYLEAHIEQGPVLESMDCALGIVSSIAGQSRRSLRFVGQAGHAGTQPMELRRDALTAASDFALAVERIGRETAGLRATVGRFIVSPGATNVVPGQVDLSLDVRHENDLLRVGAVEKLLSHATEIGNQRNVTVTVDRADLDAPAVPCDKAMTARLELAVKAKGQATPALVSGAGHDAVIMATRCPVAMLLLRSPGGISHHPDESVRREDVRAALETMIAFLERELDLE